MKHKFNLIGMFFQKLRISGVATNKVIKEAEGDSRLSIYGNLVLSNSLNEVKGFISSKA